MEVPDGAVQATKTKGHCSRPQRESTTMAGTCARVGCQKRNSLHSTVSGGLVLGPQRCDAAIPCVVGLHPHQKTCCYQRLGSIWATRVLDEHFVSGGGRCQWRWMWNHPQCRCDCHRGRTRYALLSEGKWMCEAITHPKHQISKRGLSWHHLSGVLQDSWNKRGPWLTFGDQRWPTTSWQQQLAHQKPFPARAPNKLGWPRWDVNVEVIKFYLVQTGAHLANTGYVAPSPNHVQHNIHNHSVSQCIKSPWKS